MNPRIKYSGTEKIEQKIYEELDEKIETRLNALADETRSSVINEIREELQPETVPYDRLRLIEQRIHEISTTQDGIVREIVDLKTTIMALSKELEKANRTGAYEAPMSKNPYDTYLPEAEVYEARDTESPFSSYTPYPTATPADARRTMQPPGFGSNEPSGPATPITPVTFNARKADGWEYQEFMPVKKNNAEPEKFVPAKTIPASNDPFYFADSEEEILDVSSLREPEPQRERTSPFENIPLTIQKSKVEEQEIPDRSEYIIGNNQNQRAFEKDDDYNANCEYIIAEKDIGNRKFSGRRGSKPQGELKERVISSDEDDTEIITYE